MNNQEIQPILEASIGKPVALRFQGATDEFVVLAVHSDGVLCRSKVANEQEEGVEFWIAFADLTGFGHRLES